MTSKVDIQSDIVSDKFDHFIDAFKGIKNITKPYMFFENGVYSGRFVTLDSQSVSLGSGNENNIVFLDEGFPEKAAILNFNGTNIGTSVNIKALNDALIVDEKTKISPNTNHTFRLPVKIEINETIIKVGYNLPNFMKWRDGLLALLIAGICTIFIYSFLVDYLTHIRVDKQQSRGKWVQPEHQSQPLKVAPKSQDLGKQVKANIQDKINEFGFADYLKISDLTESTIRITGIVSKTRAKEWYDLELWIDSNNNGLFIQRQVIIEDMEKIEKHISGIVISNKTIWVISKNGLLLNIGDEIWNKWNITSITKKQITFEKEGITWTVQNGDV